jgi:Ca2+:H+ antiporter
VRASYYLVVLVPVALALDLLDAPAPAVFGVSAIAVIPGAALMGEATEQLAEHAGPGVAGLLNVTFGNAPELIIALFALADGLQEVVKASLVGSVMGNALLVLGASMLAGAWRRRRQTYNVHAARALSGVLLIGTTALLAPSLVRLAEGGELPRIGAEHGSFGSTVEGVSIGVSVALIAVYARGLLSSLRSQREQFEPAKERPRWSARRAAAVLAVSAVSVAVASDTLVGSVEHASSELGLSQFFIGAIVVAIVGNAAEHYVAVVAAVRDRLDLTLSIAVGSAAQVGLLVAPVVALLSLLIGPSEMPLVFNGYELVALVAAGGLAAAATFDGFSTRRRGAGLLLAYLALAVAFLLA